MRNIAAAIEFGTSKIVCIIGREKSAGRFEVLGSGESKYEGFRKGRWLKPSGVEEAAAKALYLAEKKAKKRVKEIYVGVPGVFSKVVCKDGRVDIKSGTVKSTDISMLINEAERFSTETKYSVITSTPVFFILDDNNHYIDVFGNRSTVLRGRVSFVLARNQYLSNITKVMKRLNIEVKAFIPEMLAESLFLIPTQERDNSAVLLNIGYYDTNVTVVYGDAIVYNKTVGVGGMQIANDLALVMNIDVDLAEQIKRRYSFGLGGSDKLFDFAKDKSGKMQRFNHNLVSEIIEARVEHLCQMVVKEFARSPITIARRTRIYLSGGGVAMMRGARDTIQKYLKRQVRLINIEAPQLSSPNYHAALSLLDYVFESDYISEGPKRKTLPEKITGKKQD